MTLVREEIRKKLTAAFGSRSFLFPAIVLQVDEDKLIADIAPLENADIIDVRLKAAIDGVKDGIVEIPTPESTVLVALIGDDEYVIVKCSQVDKVMINGGSLGGLINIETLKEELAKMTARIDGVYDAINNGVPAPQDGGTALQTSMKATLSAITENEDFSNMEDDKVQH